MSAEELETQRDLLLGKLLQIFEIAVISGQHGETATITWTSASGRESVTVESARVAYAVIEIVDRCSYVLTPCKAKEPTQLWGMWRKHDGP